MPYCTQTHTINHRPQILLLYRRLGSDSMSKWPLCLAIGTARYVIVIPKLSYLRDLAHIENPSSSLSTPLLLSNHIPSHLGLAESVILAIIQCTISIFIPVQIQGSSDKQQFQPSRHLRHRGCPILTVIAWGHNRLEVMPSGPSRLHLNLWLPRPAVRPLSSSECAKRPHFRDLHTLPQAVVT
jgi:hypothetical protein